MDVQEAVAEGATENGEVKRDGRKQFQMGPGDILEGKLIYDGSIHADGRVEGEVRVTGNIDVANGANVKALLEGSNVSLKGAVEGAVTARDKLTLGKNARLSGDVVVKRLQIDDGATLNGHVRMGEFEHQAPGQ
ncbi:MAG: polymer-forming cytoskeletal protein [Chloroflexi bacterium]|nr:MAG: polymer-forming cytoskeletal protein [Chloroflexota bacterium]